MVYVLNGIAYEVLIFTQFREKCVICLVCCEIQMNIRISFCMCIRKQQCVGASFPSYMGWCNPHILLLFST